MRPRQAHADGRPPQAEATYLQALAVEPENALVLNNLGLVYVHANMLDNARHCFKRAVDVGDDPAFAQANLQKLERLQRRRANASAGAGTLSPSPTSPAPKGGTGSRGRAGRKGRPGGRGRRGRANPSRLLSAPRAGSGVENPAVDDDDLEDESLEDESAEESGEESGGDSDAAGATTGPGPGAEKQTDGGRRREARRKIRSFGADY